jgi:hypothetical protein
MLKPVLELALIHVAASINESTFALHLALFEVSFVEIAVGELFPALAII